MVSGIDARLRERNLILPALHTPGGNYLPAKTIGSIVFLACVISIGPDGVISGTAGLGRSVDGGCAAARHSALIQLAVLKIILAR